MNYPVIISIEQFQERAFADTDYCEWWELLELDSCGEATDERLAAKYAGHYIHVSWPDHVKNCRYNGDANYSLPFVSLAEARQNYPDAKVYGD